MSNTQLNFFVYKHVAPNKKVYIGITSKSKVENRWGKNGNNYKSKNKNGNYSHFYKSILKYGWDNFEHKVLAHGLTKEQACRWEIKLIKHYRSNKSEFGYNLTTGGESYEPWNKGKTGVFSDEVRKKLSEQRKGKTSPNKGKKTPQHIKTKISLVLKEYYKTHEHHNKGKKLTEECKEKIRNAHIGKHVKELNNMYGLTYGKSPRARSVVCLETLKTFTSIKEAQEKTGCKKISECCSGNRKTTGSYHWMYYAEFIKNIILLTNPDLYVKMLL